MTDEIDILSECLRSIEKGKSTIEQAIATYPEYPDLGAKLRLAMGIRNTPHPALADVRKRAIERRLLQVMQTRQPVRPLITWGRGLLLASALIIALIGGSVGLAQVAKSALPGQSLYGYKRFTEDLEASVVAGTRPSLVADRAQERLRELQLIAVQGEWIDPRFLYDTVDAVNTAITEGYPEYYNQGVGAFRFAASIQGTGVNPADQWIDELVNPTLAQTTPEVVAVGATPTITASPTSSSSVTPSYTATNPATNTVAPTNTLTQTATRTSTSTATQLEKATTVATATQTVTASPQLVMLPSETPLPPTATVTPLPPTPVDSPTQFIASPIPVDTVAPSFTPNPLIQPSVTPTLTWTLTPINTLTPTPFVIAPCASATPTSTPTSADNPTQSPAEITPTETDLVFGASTTPIPCQTWTPTPTLVPPTATWTFTLTPTDTPMVPTSTETSTDSVPVASDASATPTN